MIGHPASGRVAESGGIGSAPHHRDRGVVNREAARAAAAGIREMSNGVTLGGLKIKDLVNEGRR